MKITAIRSDRVYSKIVEAPLDKKNDIYRYELMMPFERKWACYGVPMKAATSNGYDVIMASDMLGHIAPTKVDETQKHNIALISNDILWKECELSIKRSLNCFVEHGIELPVKEYLFTILLANCESPYIMLNEGYCGDGGIPGYIFSWLTPNEYTLEHLPVALAHETNHNVRFQFVKWKNDYIKPIIREGLNVQGLENLNAYLYGDEMAALQNYPQVGLPYCAGYACGYHLVKHYLKKTGKHIVEATLFSAKEILDATEDFWNE